MNGRRFLALTLSLLLLASCGGGGGSAPAGGVGGGGSLTDPVGRIPPLDPGEAPDDPGPSFEWRYFAAYPDSKSSDARNVVARTPEEFGEAWSLMMHPASLGPGMDPYPSQPDLDFEEEIVVAVFIGDWQGHCTVSITNIVPVGDGARVEYEQYVGSPEPEAPFSRPYAAALMTRVEGEITFSGRIVRSGQ